MMPVGAVLAVLVFEAALASGLTEAGSLFIFGICKAFVVGTVVGLMVGYILCLLLKRHWIPDFLQNSFVLMGVVFAFVIANFFQHESGLLAVTFLGIIMGNQREVSIQHVVDFKENLQVLLIAVLFVILSARLDLEQLGFDSKSRYFIRVVFNFYLSPYCRIYGNLWSKTNFQRTFIYILF